MGGPERLPNHVLEREWLGQIRADGGGPPVAELVARTCIASRFDLVAGPSVRQGLGLLRRATLLGRLAGAA